MIVAGLVLSLQTADTTLVEEYRFGSFSNADRIATDLRGRIAVVDEGDQQVAVFSDDRSSPIRVGGFGWAAGSFDRPSGVASDGVNLFVADYGNHRIQRFDRSLSYVSSLMTRDSADSNARFGYPAGVAVTTFGDLLVLDGENRRLVRFTAGAQFDGSFAPASSGRPPLTAPVKVVALSDGRILLAERDRVTVMDQFGTVLRTVSHPWLATVCGLGGNAAKAIAVTAEGLLLLSEDGGLTTIPNRNILGASADAPFRDVAIFGNRIYLLTARTVICCRIP